MGRALERYGLLFVRIYLGAFNLASGANHFLQITPRPVGGDPITVAYTVAATNAGLFTVAKILEITAGAMLLFNIAPALALILLVPVTTTIFGLNFFSSPLPHIQASGARNMLFHAILFASYASYYYPMMTLRQRPAPFWRKPGQITQILKAE